MRPVVAVAAATVADAAYYYCRRGHVLLLVPSCIRYVLLCNSSLSFFFLFPFVLCVSFFFSVVCSISGANEKRGKGGYWFNLDNNVGAATLHNGRYGNVSAFTSR